MKALSPGDRVGPYEIVTPLRSGGMAALYLGRRSGPAGFSKPVAIKIVHPHLAGDSEFVQMFLDEARLAARISDPHVVRVEALGEADGLYYIAMEYVLGASLADVVQRLKAAGRRLNPSTAIAIVIEAADGLHAAHELRGEDGAPLEVVHRDVSPQNVLVSRAGHVKVIDFGIALSRSHLRQTEAGSLKGKLGYMSPEQAWGKPVDRRADVFSLGVVLFELLTLRRLFKGDNEIETLELVRSARDLTPPSAFAPDVSAAVDAVVARALAPDLTERYASAKDLRLALVEACPAALHVHSDDLGALVEQLKGEELEREQARLAEFGAEWADGAQGDRGPVLDRLTHASALAEPDATKASRPSAIARGAVGPLAKRAPEPASSAALTALAVGLGVVAAIGGVLFGLSLLDPGEPAIEVPEPTRETGPRAGCAAAQRVDGAMGETRSLPLDTRSATSAFALRSARNSDVPPAPEIVIDYRVPPGAGGALNLSTVNPGTDPRFDTLIAVFRGACDASMQEAEPEVILDDHGREFRASGSVAVEGGETLTLVVTGYGGDLSNRVDRGLVQLDATLGPSRPPAIEEVSALHAGAELVLDVHGVDPDGDATGVAVRLLDEDGVPVALRLETSGRSGQTHHGAERDGRWLSAELSRPVSGVMSFRERATLFFEANERVALSRVARAEVTLLDAAGRQSEPRAVPVTHGEIVGVSEGCGPARVCATELTCGSDARCVADPTRAATCEGAAALTLEPATDGAWRATAQGMILPEVGRFSAQCLRRWTHGREDVYRLALPPGTWDVELSTDAEVPPGGSRRAPDTVLYARRRCLDSRTASAPVQWCNDDILPGGGVDANQRSRVSLLAVEGPEVFVFVELWGSALPDVAGERYELSVRATPSAR